MGYSPFSTLDLMSEAQRQLIEDPMGNSEAADETTYIGIPEKPRRLEAVPRSADKYGKEATEIMIKNSAQEILLQIQDVVGDFFVDKDGGPPGAEFSDSSAVL